MNKKELIRLTSLQTGIPRADCERILDALLEITSDELAEGGELLLSGFGALRVKERASRIGVHPRTGEPMEISAKKTVVFKAGGALQAKLEGDSTLATDGD